MGSKKGQKNKKDRQVPKKNILINEDSLVQCQWCKVENKAKTWNTLTYDMCTSREMKRAFRPIYSLQVWGKESDHFYKCPSCSIWSRGNQLILLDKNGDKIGGIGGRPIATDN